VILMAKKGYIPRLNKRIQNLSRAINKIDPAIQNKLLFAEHRIVDVIPGINTIKYSKDGVRQEIRYDELENLSQKEQGSLHASLTVDRYNLRQEKAITLLKNKGKISWQFKRSLEQDNPVLLKSIEEFEDITKGTGKDVIKDEFEKADLSFDEWEQDAAEYFEYKAGQEYRLYDFYKPDQTGGGFRELNQFSWNAYKILRTDHFGPAS